MAQPYTHGIWVTKPGREDDFVAAWTEFAQWTKREVADNVTGRLLRDINTPNRFISFGLWDSLEQIAEWRARDGWKERVDRLQELLETFEPATLEQVAELE